MPAPIRKEAPVSNTSNTATSVTQVLALILDLRAARTRDAARAALVALGNEAVRAIGDHLADDAVPVPIRRELPPVLAAVGTQEAANELLRVQHPEDVVLLLRLLEAQNAIRARDPRVVFAGVSVREALQREVEIFLQLHLHVVVWRAEQRSRGRDLLLPSLEERLHSTVDRILTRLAFAYRCQETVRGYRTSAWSSGSTRAGALEVLDAVISPEDRRLLLPLLDDPDRRLFHAVSLYGLQPLDRASSLSALARGTDSWLQACALHCIGAFQLTELAPAAHEALGAAAPIVRETATWCLRQLEPA